MNINDLRPHNAIADLKEHWGSAYEIGYMAGAAAPFQATRRDDPAAVLTAKTAGDLRQAIRDDYQQSPVSRLVCT